MGVPNGSGWGSIPTTKLQDLENESTDLQRSLAHYARKTTELTIELEKIDVEMQRCFRRQLHLAEKIETEKLRSCLTG